MLHEATSGSLRGVDRGHTALRLAARKKRKLVERDIIQSVLQTSGYPEVLLD
jgi:general secretion pathway protein A